MTMLAFLAIALVLAGGLAIHKRQERRETLAKRLRKPFTSIQKRSLNVA